MNYLYCDAVASDPTIAIELYAAADMFVLERLKLKCSDMISQQLNIENSCTFCLFVLNVYSLVISPYIFFYSLKIVLVRTDILLRYNNFLFQVHY
mgnify:CR=1 FL=1